MNRFKKLLTSLSALAMIFNMAAVGFAADGDIELKDDMTGQGDMVIEGVVEPINRIDITVPVDGLRFNIKADRTIDWQDMNITSRCPAPITVSMIDAGEATLEGSEVGQYNVGGAPTLVADDTFTEEEWDNLTIAQTKQNIAISVNGQNISTASSENPIVLGTIDSAFGVDEDGNYEANEKELKLEGSALYGKSWDNTENILFKYNTILEFSMV